MTARFAWAEPRLRSVLKAEKDALARDLDTSVHAGWWSPWGEAMAVGCSMHRQQRLERLLRACETGVLPPKEGTR